MQPTVQLQAKRLDKALELLEVMWRKGLQPNVITYSATVVTYSAAIVQLAGQAAGQGTGAP